jgi:peptide/nickel transport system substrate-binding protein
MNKAHWTRVLLVTVVLVLAACGPATTPAATPAPTAATTLVAPTAAPAIQPGGELVVGVLPGVLSLDPAKAFGVGDFVIMQQIYDTLLYVDSAREIRPGLATRWEQSADAQVFTFTVRPGVTFHDGTPLDAAAVKFNFDRMGNPEIGTGSASLFFRDYSSTVVLDAATVRVTFKTAHSNFLYGIGSSSAGIVSPTAVAKWGEEYGQHPVGTGPFMFVEWVSEDHTTLERNPNYNWAPDILKHQGPAYLDRITFRYVAEDTTRLAMLQTGEASVIEQFPAQDMGLLQGDAAYYLVSGTAPGVPTIMMINTERAPTDELAVRQALIYAIDQDTLVATAYFGTEQAAHSVLAPATLYYDPVADQMYRFDLAKAKSLLEQAGWVDTNNDGVREHNGQDLAIKYPAYRNWESAYMELLKNMWTAAGFRVDMTQLEDAAAWDAAATGEHNVTNMGSIDFDAAALWPMFHSSNIAGGYAFTRFRDATLDKLLDDAANTIDPQQKAGLYAQAQRLIMEQALVVPVYAFERILAVRAEFPGVVLDWQNWFPYFYDVYAKK